MNSILVLNCGSSSIKFTLFSSKDLKLLVRGLIEGVESTKASIKVISQGAEEKKTLSSITYQEGLEFIKQWIQENEDYVGHIQAVGHRVVHGGSFFSDAQKINSSTKKTIRELFSLAPLHNAVNLKGIEFFEKEYEGKQVAVFDTAFHQTMPKTAYLYPIEQKYFEEDKIRRYGFHGTSHQYVSQKAAKQLKKPIEECSMITLHLGNGCSACAINKGKSVDTSMGFTPLEGLMMGTRCGSIDVSILGYLCEKKAITYEEALKIFNSKSGLLGVSQISHDMRELESIMESDEGARLAIDMFVYHVVKIVASYIPLLDSFDALVFTGGIGENSTLIRQKILSKLSYFGIQCDEKKNEARVEGLISKGDAPGVWVIHTNEELMIAKQTSEKIL